jgi:hypothetical protein
LIWKVKLKITVSIIIIIFNKFLKIVITIEEKPHGNTRRLSSYLGAGYNPSAHVALGLLPQCWAHPAHTWRLGCLPVGWVLLSAHVALGLPGWAMIAPPLETSGAWVMAPDSRGMGRASRPMINGFSVRTQFYWVLHQNSMFMGPWILNIIIRFRNIIIFIIINIINKIINKFERKYYYLYYKFLWHFL